MAYLKYILLGMLSCLFGTLLAQNKIPIGDWRAHLPYRQFVSVAQSSNYIYAATEWSVLQIDKDEQSLSFLSKVEGLSNAGVQLVAFSETHQALLVVYTNSAFDIVTSEQVHTFSDIGTDGNFTNRSIENVHINENDLYFACGFGVVRFNLEVEEFDFTLNLGVRVYDITTFNNQVYAATEEGIYTASLLDGLNLQDFTNWVLLDYTDGFPGTYSSTAIEVFDDRLYFDVNGALYYYENNTPTELYPAEDNLFVQYLTAEGNGLLVGLRCAENCAGKTLYVNDNALVVELGNFCSDRPLDALEDEQGRFWLADSWRGLRFAPNIEAACERMEFNSPFTHSTSDIFVQNDIVYVAAGGVNAQGSFAGRSDGTFVLDTKGDWEIINRWTVPIIEAQDAILDHYKLAVHPSTGDLYIGTFWGGIIHKSGDEYTIYNETNSTLQGAQGDGMRERVSGLAFDNQQNLWIANNAAPRPISVLKNDGTWKNFDVPSNDGVRHLTIDDAGYKWMAIDGTGEGVLVFDDAGTIDDTSDDRYRIIASNNSDLPDNIVFSIAVDLEGAVWLGTANGVAVVNCGSAALDADCPVSKIVFEENIIDDEDEYLLKGETVNAIAVDGANRKWFGTTNGLFVISPDGKEQIAFFDESNSPLFDNNIIALGINDTDGEVFIGTNKGMLSYRSDATKGGNTHKPEVYAFPNPVQPDYRGPIAIKGLAENANVKITDISGQLIYETQALGGQAVWNGNDYNGRRASTGVYLVFSTSQSLETPDTHVTKILFIN